MYLGGLVISRFRSCDNVTVSLRPDLTVLVGENNGGKSNVVDAIRLYAEERKEAILFKFAQPLLYALFASTL